MTEHTDIYRIAAVFRVFRYFRLLRVLFFRLNL